MSILGTVAASVKCPCCGNDAIVYETKEPSVFQMYCLACTALITISDSMFDLKQTIEKLGGRNVQENRDWSDSRC